MSTKQGLLLYSCNSMTKKQAIINGSKAGLQLSLCGSVTLDGGISAARVQKVVY